MKKGVRKIRALETKKKIYDIANKLFREHGFENASVDSIVEKAGISKGAFYVHFDSKDSLAVALMNDYVKEVDLDYKAYIDSFSPEASASDILISLIGKIADILNLTIGCDNMKTLYKAQITKTVDTNSVMGYNRELYKMLSDILNKGVQQEEFRTEIPVDMLAKHCMIAYRGLTYEWCIRHPDFDLKKEALKHFEMLLNGIKKQE